MGCRSVGESAIGEGLKSRRKQPNTATLGMVKRNRAARRNAPLLPVEMLFHGRNRKVSKMGKNGLIFKKNLQLIPFRLPLS